MLTFASPLYFALFVPLAAAAWWIYRRRVRHGLVFARAHECLDARPTWRMRAAAFLPMVSLLAMALLIIALARPRTVLSYSRRTADVIAIEMVVDVSGSMEALDLSDIVNNRITRPRTRLDVVKEVFAEFIRKRPDDLIGLVTFGGFASTRCPLTADHEALLHVLEGVAIPKPAPGREDQAVDREELLTAVGDALATASARVRDAAPKSKIVVLLSDGESNTGVVQPDAAIEVARKLGLKVYTIGVGTTGPAPFLARDVFGREALQYADVTMDEALLKRIAQETGARYFNVRDPEGLQAALASIDTLEKTRVERDQYEQYDELFPRVLLPGLLLLILGTALNMLTVRRLI